jgi:nucleotide-binding universal stress UspA family protein
MGMMRHLMLTLLSYPSPTPEWAIAAADDLAVHLDAELCAALCVVNIRDVSNMLARHLLGADEAIAAENRQSRANADALASRFAAVVGSSDIHRQFRLTCWNMADPRALARHARLFDMTVLPLFEHPDIRWLVEGLLFDSGRPLLLLPKREGQGWSRIVIGWDGSRAAARALADAMPLCRRAKAVEIVTITGEKELPADLSPADIRHHLALHGITATSRMIALEEGDAGTALLAHARAESADLLVMGGFGHSRMREFLLGGATSTVVHRPSLPVLVAH